MVRVMVKLVLKSVKHFKHYKHYIDALEGT